MRRAVTDALLDELSKVCANPFLGSVYYGGPYEKRLIYRYSVTVQGSVEAWQFMYRVAKDRSVVVVSGFERVPSDT